jgi:hypothetical protein
MKTFVTNKGGVKFIAQTRLNHNTCEYDTVEIEVSAPQIRNPKNTFTMFIRISGEDFKQFESIFTQDEN